MNTQDHLGLEKEKEKECDGDNALTGIGGQFPMSDMNLK